MGTVSFNVPASAYGRFMGQYSEPLAAHFVDFAGATPGQTALDVGCGTGALTAQLVTRLGDASVAAIDPSESFVEATRQRLPGVRVEVGIAENLPWEDDSVDLTMAQLVVHFMSDPVAGIREMARVTIPGGVVAACVWDHAGGRGPLTTFWNAARDIDPAVHDESGLAGTREGHLAELFQRAELTDIEPGALRVVVSFADFDEWWEPYTLGVGPAGAYTRRLDDAQRERLKARCAELLPPGAFDVEAVAWAVRGRA
ncbi:MAG: Methyltransferase type 11 [Rhodoglobus sp.]|nr:Methyltransferase type 11 [Rhodoglobus sp.]